MGEGRIQGLTTSVTTTTTTTTTTTATAAAATAATPSAIAALRRAAEAAVGASPAAESTSESPYESDDLYFSEDLYASDEESDGDSSVDGGLSGVSEETEEGEEEVEEEEEEKAAPAVTRAEEEQGEGEEEQEEGSLAPHRGHKVVLVTGAGGFIGSATAAALLARGDRVIGVDEMNDYYDLQQKENNVARLSAAYPSRFSFVQADICDVEAMGRVFSPPNAADKPAWVVHLAARAGVRPSIEDPLIYVHSNIEGTTKLLELARSNDVQHFVFASSSSVYGGSRNSVFRETDSVDLPVSPYAASKKTCELLAHTWSHLYQLNVAGLRFFTVYGPNGRPDMAPYKFVDSVATGKELLQFGDGSSSRDYTFVDDIVDGVLRTLDRPDGYQIYNLGNGGSRPVFLREFIATVERLVGRKATIRVLPDQPGDVPRTCADISKAREKLGYAPSVAFEEGMRRTVAWYLSRHSTALPPAAPLKAPVVFAESPVLVTAS